MSKVQLHNIEGIEGIEYIEIPCKACGSHHVPVAHAHVTGAWGFNYDFKSPTVTPSLKVSWGGTPRVCHFVLTNGVMQYCGDCTHEYANQNIKLDDIN